MVIGRRVSLEPAGRPSIQENVRLRTLSLGRETGDQEGREAIAAEISRQPCKNGFGILQTAKLVDDLERFCH